MFNDGRAYNGEWKNDFFYGVGAYLTKEGNIIEGHYCGNELNPFKMRSDSDLKILFKNGELYDGKGRNGKRDGKGKFIYLDGSVYEGQWENDKRQGNGQLSISNESVIKGYWNKDKLEDC